MNGLLIIAGWMGDAAGVVLAAASADAASGVKLESAGYLLLLHASAVIAGAVALDRGLLWPPSGIVALAGLLWARRGLPRIWRCEPCSTAGCSRWPPRSADRS
jgi:hypothetical protein